MAVEEKKKQGALQHSHKETAPVSTFFVGWENECTHSSMKYPTLDAFSSTLVERSLGWSNLPTKSRQHIHGWEHHTKDGKMLAVLILCLHKAEWFNEYAVLLSVRAKFYLL